MAMTISKLAGRVGVSPDALRYYERRGLLARPARGRNGYRFYGEEAVERLRFIKNAQHMGLRLDDVQELLEIADRGACPCGHTSEVVKRRLAQIDAELDRLQAMRRQLIALGDVACTDLDRGAWWCTTEAVGGGDPE
jgi:DNA-binding transcriptional MerR regulator